MALCSELLAARVANKAKLQDVANFCGLTRLDVWQFERGVRRPNPEQLERLAHCFGVDFLDDGVEEFGFYVRW